MAGFFVVFSKSVLFMTHFDLFWTFTLILKKGQTTQEVLLRYITVYSV